MIKNIIIIILFLVFSVAVSKKLQMAIWNLLIAIFPKRIGPERCIRVAKRLIKKYLNRNNNTDPIYPIIKTEDVEEISEAIKITFTGDLILLKQMVENGYNAEKGCYEYDGMFEFVKPYYEEADFNIGVFEGPAAGEECGFSSSNFDDGLPLYLNFPKEYAKAVKKAGINLVSIANNHMLDKKTEGLYKTIDTLDEIGLAHVGAYKTTEEKNIIKIVDVKGCKIAILAYTYGSNYYSSKFFLEDKNKHLTRVLLDPKDANIKSCVKSVKRDLEIARSLSVDLIMVLPHMGEQFRHKPDSFQKFWCEVFVEGGADIIFSDHPHAVQPIEWVEAGNKKVMIAHCPGNFINSYTKHDGDASMIVECYINKETKRPFASSIVPIYAYKEFDRTKSTNYVGMPIYDLINQGLVKFGQYEYERIFDVHKIITKSALGVELPIDNIQKRYFFFPTIGYVRNMVHLQEDQILKGWGNNQLVTCFKKSTKVAFVGDSLTEGTKNGGYGWFEPLMSIFPDIQWVRFAKGSQTSKYFGNHIDDIINLNADMYIFAIGCNDIRYRIPEMCAMNETEFVDNLSEICNAVRKVKNDVTIVFVNPWQSAKHDPYCPLKVGEKERLYELYSEALQQYCKKEGFVYVDPNPYIWEKVKQKDMRYYLKDHIHCNASEGIRLFSEAFIKSYLSLN